MMKDLESRLSLSAACLLMLTGVAHGTVLHVPADYATIQAAVSAAVAGDEIVVAAGDLRGTGGHHAQILS